jgi:Sulfotransferase family
VRRTAARPASEVSPSSERELPYVFIVGCPRSGTTLLQRILDHHPKLAVANDTHFIPRVVDPEGGDVPLSPELVDRVLNYHRFGRLGLDDAAVRRAAAQTRTYAEFVGALYTEFGARHAKPLAGEKTPDYVRYLPLLGRLFPRSRVIHIIRDGRDVALSALEWARPDKGPGRFSLWPQDPVAVCALWWRWQVTSGRTDGRALGSRYQEVRYEDVVARSRETVERLCLFLQLPFAPQTLTYHVGRQREEPGLSAKSAWLPPTPGLRDWRAQMPDRDVAVFEALAGDLLSSLGYERATGVPARAVRSLTQRYRSCWEEELQRRRVRSPATHSRPGRPEGPTAR